MARSGATQDTRRGPAPGTTGAATRAGGHAGGRSSGRRDDRERAAPSARGAAAEATTEPEGAGAGGGAVVGAGERDEDGAAAAAASVRDRVLAVAIAQLERGGEAAVRIDEIRSGAGVSSGSLYHHFEDRDEIIAAAQLRRFARLAEAEAAEVTALLAAAGDVAALRRGLRQLARTALGGPRADARWVRIQALASTVGRDDLRDDLTAVQTRLIDRIAAEVAQAQARALLRADLDARAIAAQLGVLAFGLALDDLDQHGVGVEAWLAVTGAALDALLPTT